MPDINYKFNRIIKFLADMKTEVLASNPTDMHGNCGYLAAAMYLDEAIQTMLFQQTKIADLERQLEIERQENTEYYNRFGDLEGGEEDERNIT